MVQRRFKISWVLVVALFVAVSLLGCGETDAIKQADAQYRDSTFGGGGIAITDLGGSVANAVLLQPDGKIVAVGSKSKEELLSDLALERCTANGTLDPTFGNAGVVITQVGDNVRPIGAVIQPDGRIVAAGSGYFDKTTWDFALVRYNPDGSLDTGFGRGGIAIAPIDGKDNASAVALQADGRLVVAGYSTSSLPNVILVRYNSDGTLDSTFGQGGIVVSDLRTDQGPTAIAIQGDGKIVVTATMLDDRNYHDFGVWRYNQNGSPDPTFGREGKVVTDLGGVFDDATAMLVQPDGKIVVAGHTCCAIYPLAIALVRYNIEGSLDIAFGQGGIAIHRFTFSAEPTAIALQSDGKLVAVGYGDNPKLQFVIARYNPNGSLDTTFASGGKTITAPGVSSLARALAIQSDGMIVVAGYAESIPKPLRSGDFVPIRNGPFDFMLVRYRP